MITVGIIILLVSVIIFIKDHKTESSFWLSGVYMSLDYFLTPYGILVYELLHTKIYNKLKN